MSKFKLKSMSGADAKNSSNQRPRSVRIHSVWLLSVGGFLVFVLHRALLGWVLCASGLLLLLAGHLYPPLSRAIEKLNGKVSTLVAFVLGWIVLAPFYVVFFSAGHAALALRGRDPLRLKLPADASTDWLPVSTGTGEGNEDHKYPY